MSQPCEASKCERTARALCDCCKQKLCLQHLREHNASLVAQLNPLTDEINAIGDRLNQLHLHETTRSCREQLERWRQECYEKIDRFFQQKCQELDRLAGEKLHKRREEFTHIKTTLSKLMSEQEVTQQDIETLTATTHRLEKELNEGEQEGIRVRTNPLFIDDCTVQFHEIRKSQFDLSNLEPAYKTIKYLPDSFRLLANNDQLLLIYQIPNLCFLDTQLRLVTQFLWPHDSIIKICWSSILNRFIAIVKDSVFLIDEHTMSISKTSIPGKQPWFSCSCFNNQLFLSTNTWGSSIIEAILSPSIIIVKEWKSPTTCTMDELIDDMVHSNETLALMIRSKVEKSMRIELRLSETLDRLWSLGLDGVYGTAMAFRCCSIDQGGWLLADHGAGHLLHVTIDGGMKQAISYKPIPYRITLFDSNILVVTTKDGINFHKIELNHQSFRLLFSVS